MGGGGERDLVVSPAGAHSRRLIEARSSEVINLFPKQQSAGWLGSETTAREGFTYESFLMHGTVLELEAAAARARARDAKLTAEW